MRFVLSCFFLVLGSFCVSAQNNLQGIVNVYTPVTAISCNTITVGSTVGFVPGSAVLIIQMKGAEVDQTNTSTSGDIIDYNDVGNYELNAVMSVSGSDVVLQFPLIQTYDVTQAVQLIRVPVNNDATIAATVSAQPWNGSTGGVIALMCTGTLTMNADIDASGSGYAGGAITSGGFGCSNFGFTFPSNTAGFKGESVAKFVSGMEAGRGKWAGGGGGGNPGNSGGGGGALGGNAGLGGNEYSGCGATGIQGYGGVQIAYDAEKVFMGSGGGGGYADNVQSVTPGTNGGGIVIIRATNLDGNNHFIKSNGPNQDIIANDESAGGGGSGGSVYLDVQNFLSPVEVEINGGKGGDTYNNIFSSECHGTGGGGSGGYLALSLAAIPANVTVSSTGGVPGLVLNPISSCYNQPFGATSGADGVVQFNLEIPESNLQLPEVSLGNDTTVCPGTFTLAAPAGYDSYLWQNGATTSSIAIDAAGPYSVVVTSGAGCAATDTIVISIPPVLSLQPLADTVICPEAGVTLSIEPGYSYLWSNGETTQSITVADTGFFSVTITDATGCSTTDDALVANFQSPVIDLGDDVLECEGGSVTIQATPGFATYQWNTGESNDALTTSTEGIYNVTVTDANGCSASDNILFTNTPVTLEAIDDAVFCSPYLATVEAPGGYVSYQWSNGSFGQTAMFGDSGTYTVTVTDVNGCTASGSFHVSVYCEPSVFCPNAFSPNADALNDKFRCITYHVTSFDLRIFNRWGQMMFHSTNPDVGWDGTFKNQLCPVGTYAFTIAYTLDDGAAPKSGTQAGNLTLMR